MSQAFNRQLREGLHTSFDLMIQWKLVCWSQKQKQKNQPITRPITENCNWFIVPLLLPTSDNQQPKYTGIIFKKNLAQLIWLPYRKEKKGPELIFFYGYRGWWYFSWAHTHVNGNNSDDDGVALDGGHTPANSLTETGAQVKSSSRSHVFFVVDHWPISGFQLDCRLIYMKLTCNQDWVDWKPVNNHLG